MLFVTAPSIGSNCPTSAALLPTSAATMMCAVSSTAVWALKLGSNPPPVRVMMRLAGSVKLSCALGSGTPNSRL